MSWIPWSRKRSVPDTSMSVIATKTTINSGIYASGFATKVPGMQGTIPGHALLAPMIEEVLSMIRSADRYWIPTSVIPNWKASEALLLACTHYPLIRREIEDWYHHKGAYPGLDGRGGPGCEKSAWKSRHPAHRDATSPSVLCVGLYTLLRGNHSPVLARRSIWSTWACGIDPIM